MGNKSKNSLKNGNTDNDVKMIINPNDNDVIIDMIINNESLNKNKYNKKLNKLNNKKYKNDENYSNIDSNYNDFINDISDNNNGQNENTKKNRSNSSISNCFEMRNPIKLQQRNSRENYNSLHRF